MGNPLGPPVRLVLTTLLVCSAGSSASAQSQGPKVVIQPVTHVAAISTGSITGTVLNEAGQPLDGVVISALGGSSGFAVTDRTGAFQLRSLTPGPYLLRAHLQGYLPARNAMVNVRPAASTTSSFKLRREGPLSEAPVVAAGVGATSVSAPPATSEPRDESETTWRLRHLKRPILKDATLTTLKADDEWFITDSFELLGRAMETSARAAGDFIAHFPFQGQVNLLTTGAFDTPMQLLQLDRTSSVAYFVVGAPVGLHGDWTVKAALNQGDLRSWILSGDYQTREAARHRYRFGMSYALHTYDGGNALALAALPDAARNVGMVYAHDQWTVSPWLTVGYGGNYAHYDYLPTPAHLSPRVSATFRVPADLRIHAIATRQIIAPGAEEFLAPPRATVLPPQRTFAPLTRDGFVPEELLHYELGVERSMRDTTIGVRAFEQRIDQQLVTVFGYRTPEAPAAELGHYVVASAGDVALRGWSVSLTHTLANRVRGSIDYSVANADWRNPARTSDLARLERRVPSAVRSDERIHDVTTSVETTVPQTATRVFFLVKLNSAYIAADASGDHPALDGRFELQVSQSLPFLNFLRAEWEMLVGVRNLFRDSFSETSLYDELLVARPPKRLVGGLTVKF